MSYEKEVDNDVITTLFFNYSREQAGVENTLHAYSCELCSAVLKANDDQGNAKDWAKEHFLQSHADTVKETLEVIHRNIRER